MTDRDAARVAAPAVSTEEDLELETPTEDAFEQAQGVEEIGLGDSRDPEAPEADAMEQSMPVGRPATAAPARRGAAGVPLEADEADVNDQAEDATAGFDEEDYR